MQEAQNKVKKNFVIARDFVFNGHNVYEGDILKDHEVYEVQGKIKSSVTGLIHRGFIKVQYNEPKRKEEPKPECPAVSCIEESLECSPDYEIQLAQETRRRKTRKVKNADISIKDQQFVDAVNDLEK